jgi:hypothetical protein
MNATIIENTDLFDATNRVDAALTAIKGRHQLTGGEVTDLLLDLRGALRQAADLEALLAVAADAMSSEPALAD